jgi:hypothetical protein
MEKICVIWLGRGEKRRGMNHIGQWERGIWKEVRRGDDRGIFIFGKKLEEKLE